MKINNTIKYKNVFKGRCLTCPQVRYTRFSQQLEVVFELQTSVLVDLTDQKSSIQRFGLVRP